MGFLPQETRPNSCHKLLSPDLGVLQDCLSSGSGGDRSHFTSRPEHTWSKLAKFRLGTKHYLQQIKRAYVDGWPEGQSGQDTIAVEHMQPILEIFLEVPGPDE